MATKNVNPVNVNNFVANLEQGLIASRSTKSATSTLNQARKAFGGIQNEAIVIGRNDEKKKIYTTIGKFMEQVGCPYSGGQVSLSSIKNAVPDYLKDSEGNLCICKNVVQRVKIGKQTYPLYYKNENGEFKSVSIYQPANVRDNGWNTYLICVMLAQGHFLDETIALVDASKAAYEGLKSDGNLYVHDNLTGEYVKVNVK